LWPKKAKAIAIEVAQILDIIDPKDASLKKVKNKLNNTKSIATANTPTTRYRFASIDIALSSFKKQILTEAIIDRLGGWRC
jgi:hypothetical protein